MRASAWVMAAALAALASGASAETKAIPTVVSGAAAWSRLPNTITLNAVVQLNDTCWSNPRFMPPLAAKPAPGRAAPVQPTEVPILADHATGKMCGMVVRQVKVPTRQWRIYPDPQLKSLKFVGSAQPVTVVIARR
ncbi:MAG TPA: hypothetical protein VN694_13210 [Caulobacteraceae bacterium]|nr:hypothetical protein [Caulobacteraceae bacterium]